MKKNSLFIIILVCTCFPFSNANAKEPVDIKSLFPEVEGFHKIKEIATYTPGNLYEIINGAADIFLNYEFRELAYLTLESADEQSLTIEIYRHENPEYGFGIYSAERAFVMNFVDAGVEGYYETGVLNFYKDRFYIKMRGVNLNNEEAFLLNTAKQIAAKIPGSNSFPAALDLLPKMNRQYNRITFLPRNFLGYSFFNRAYLADYATPSGNFKFFVMQRESQDECHTIIQSYLNHLNVTDQEIIEGRFTLEDPYYGTVELKWENNCIKGIFGTDNKELSEKYINLDPSSHLIKKDKTCVSLNKPVSSSSVESPRLRPEDAVDGDLTTRWASASSDPQWISVDLLQEYLINKVKLYWENAFGKSYKIEVSSDAKNWTEVYTRENGKGGEDEINFSPIKGRYVRMYGLERGTPWGYSLFEFRVFKRK